MVQEIIAIDKSTARFRSQKKKNVGSSFFVLQINSYQNILYASVKEIPTKTSFLLEVIG